MSADSLVRRLFFAANEAERRLGRRVTLEEWGVLVSEHEDGRSVPYAPAVVGRWLKGQQEPASVPQRVALARALGVDPGWLFFGGASRAPAPEGWATTEARQLRAAEPAASYETPDVTAAKRTPPRGAKPSPGGIPAPRGGEKRQERKKGA